MLILYAVTIRPKGQPGSAILHKLKLVASDQVQAFKLACEKAEMENMEVCRVEELEVLKQTNLPLFLDADLAGDLVN